MRPAFRSWLAAGVVGGCYLVALFAPFLAPYDPGLQHRTLPYAPPMRVHWLDSRGELHLRPFVYGWTVGASGSEMYMPDLSNPITLRLFTHDSRRHWHLLGAGGAFLLGTDEYGRDQLSRLIFGTRVSLTAGLLATALALFIAAALGACAGFYGGIADAGLMRLSELFLAIPWLYLLLAVRAVLPLRVPSSTMLMVCVGLLGVIGWARPARLLRGVVLSAREREFVTSARGFGAGSWHLLRRHILPETLPVLLTQAALLVPQFILAEVTLSFLGLGTSEPTPSWGSMLASLQHYEVLTQYWWMALPLGLLIPIFAAFQVLADDLQHRLGWQS